jgi:surfactin synthase thioesterase subunit
MKIIFSHGKESGPWGTKIQALAAVAIELACEVESIDYRGMDNPDERVQKLQNFLAEETNDYILVGSSMGGYVSIIAASDLHPQGVFLIAPALYMPGYENKPYALTQANVCIVHGRNDEIIPWENSLRYAKDSQCELHLIDGDHRLTSAVNRISELFKMYLKDITS